MAVCRLTYYAEVFQSVSTQYTNNYFEHTGSFPTGSQRYLELAGHEDTYAIAFTTTNRTVPAIAAEGGLMDTPPDFTSATAVTVGLRIREVLWVNDVRTLYARVYQSDGTTALTNEVQVFTSSAAATADQLYTVAMTGVVGADKTVWDGAVLSLRYTYSGNMGADSGFCGTLVNYAYIDVTYTPSSSTFISQAAYRWYEDGTLETTPALAAQDTALTLNVATDQIVQLRMRMQLTTALALTNYDNLQLQWEKNANGTWQNVVCDPYPTIAVGGSSWVLSNKIGQQTFSGLTGDAQGFIGNGQVLSKVGIPLQEAGSPARTVTVEIQTQNATTKKPSGTVVATSTTSHTAATIVPGTWTYFSFDETFTLVNGTRYYIVMKQTGPAYDTNNTFMNVLVGRPPAFVDGFYVSTTSTGWGNGYFRDMIFNVLTKGSNGDIATVVAMNTAAVGIDSNPTERLTGGTGTFNNDLICNSEFAQWLELNGRYTWTGNNYTEVVCSLKVKAAGVANGDTLRFRTLWNGQTYPFVYSVTPTLNVVKVTGLVGTVDPAVLTLSGVTPTLAPSSGTAITSDVTSLALIGQTPTIAGSSTVTVAVDTATMTIIGQETTLTAPVIGTADSATLIFSGQTPTLSGAGPATATVNSTTLVLIGQNTALASSSAAIATADSATLTLTGQTMLAATGPDPPTSLAGTPGNAQVALTWTAPASDGGSPITDYVVQYRPVT